jgi:hypothetical protein
LSLKPAILPYEEVPLSIDDPSILPPYPFARPSNYPHTHIEIEETREAFGGAAGRIIPRLRTLRGCEEGEGGEEVRERWRRLILRLYTRLHTAIKDRLEAYIIYS